MSEFARTGTTASNEPVALTPGDPQGVAGVARPAVLVEETTVPASSSRAVRASAPMAIAPPQGQIAEAEATDQAIEPAAVNLNEVPAQPKSKLLSPAEKARVIAELEALAKRQSAALGKTEKSAD